MLYLYHRSRRLRLLRPARFLRFGADVQIGGGMHVGDAFQAIVRSLLIAIWDGGFVSKFLGRGIRVSLALNKGNTHLPPAIAPKAK
jgi:hypothetical protein